MTLVYILAACAAGSVLSALAAALLAWRIQPRAIPVFVSYAVGALLGVVFLDLLPHIFSHEENRHGSASWILVGIIAFFVLEKLVLWRHSHDHDHGAHAGHTHEHDLGRKTSAWMIIIGDAFHNFTDGVAIAVAFYADTRLGVVTALAIIAHELPSELSDFLVLIHSGFSRARALFWNLISSLATMLGALLAFVSLDSFRQYADIFLCFAAASMIYVAIADLIPGLHRRSSLRDGIQQIVLIVAGIGSILVVHRLLDMPASPFHY